MGVERNREVNPSNSRNSVEKYCPPPLRKLKESSENSVHSTTSTPPAASSITTKSNPISLPQNKEFLNEKETHKIPQIETDSAINSTGTSKESNTEITVNTTRPNRRERRPDRDFYVPRARRSQTLIPNEVRTSTSIQDLQITSTLTNSHKKVHKESNNHHHQNNSGRDQQNSSTSHHKNLTKNSVETSIENHHLFPSNTIQSLANIQIDGNITTFSPDVIQSNDLNSKKDPVIQIKLSNNDNCDNTASDNIIRNNFNNFANESLSTNIQNNKSNPPIVQNNHCYNSELVVNDYCDNLDDNKKAVNSTNIRVKPSLTNCNQIHQINQHILEMNKTNKGPNNTISNYRGLRIEDASTRQNDKIDHETEELQRASKEINRSNRRIMKQTFKSDVLEIPEPNLKTENNLKPDAISKSSDDTAITDDWDSMFDDNGECLDPKLIEELTATVGKVHIDTPKADYSAYLMKQDILSDEEFPHVLEISNFPIEFKTQDLMMIFSHYKETGFDIKWVDDTHALAVFSSSKIAAEVLAKHHPFVVLKPLAEATYESRAKAKKCSSSLQPYRPRPETCAALARRLVTGALGVRLKTAAQEREVEKRVLKEAKERKLLAAKQRDEVWES